MTVSAPKPSISFVVPALNEEGNIEGAVRTILGAAEGLVSELEILLVNDGSTDQTGRIMDRLAKEDPRIRVIHNPRNLGFGGAFKAGAAKARLEYVIRICGDDSVPIPGVRLILDQVGRADFVIPFIANPGEFRSWGRRFGSWGFTTLVNLLFGQNVPYYNHSVVFRRDALHSIKIATDSFAYQAEALTKLLKAGYNYVSIGVHDIARLHGESTALKPSNVIRVVQALVHLATEIRRPGSVPKRIEGRVQSITVADATPAPESATGFHKES
jgi:glycosyltransferase involved in cell wall biosynthesis